jgi:hypothetical protein
MFGIIISWDTASLGSSLAGVPSNGKFILITLKLAVGGSVIYYSRVAIQ